MLTVIYSDDSNKEIFKMLDADTLYIDNVIKINHVSYKVVSSQKFSGTNGNKQVLRVEKVDDDDFEYSYVFKSKTKLKKNNRKSSHLSLV